MNKVKNYDPKKILSIDPDVELFEISSERDIMLSKNELSYYWQLDLQIEELPDLLCIKISQMQFLHYKESPMGLEFEIVQLPNGIKFEQVKELVYTLSKKLYKAIKKLENF
jgi:hypothetical protein